MRRKIIGVVLMLLLGSAVVVAQGGQLNYGDNVVATLPATNPLAFYSFTGTGGDQVSVQVIGITPGLDPAVSLNGPTQQQLASNDNDPNAPGTTDARIAVNLPQDGVYTVLVSSVSGLPGDFLIRLNGQQPAAGQPVSDTPTSADVAGGGAQLFSIEANPSAPSVLTVSSDLPDFEFRVVVRDANGAMIALLVGSGQTIMTLPAGTGTYLVEVTAVDPAASGQVSVSVSDALPASAPTAAPPVEATPTSTATSVDSGPSDVCEVSALGSDAVNVRSGPGTNFDTIAQLLPGTRFTAAGIYNTWYLVNIPTGGQGWIRRDVVATFGPCDTLPPVAPPAETSSTATAPADGVTATPTMTPTPPQDQPTPTATSPTAQQQQTGPTPTATTQRQGVQATPTFTHTPTQPVQATATYTPSYTPTTPPAAQIAPEDARFNNPLNIALDTTASVLDFVSYPGGDTEDRVRWDITGMNPNASLSGGRARLVLSVSCFGTGTQNIEFFTGGQTYTCGQTVVDREVTYDSRTGQLTITAVGGQNTYVQWVLTGTATRVN
ncbi:MAG: hypothetical protein CL610_22845 [Anaerolineaceae bacterium]|nr:hypothetical protein [Anaerolineaceae bacterium]